MANPTETVESVLAEMRGWATRYENNGNAALATNLREYADRLAAAYERDMALLREARNWIDNDTDEVAAVIARIDARIGATNG